jgi:hypothetical protein
MQTTLRNPCCACLHTPALGAWAAPNGCVELFQDGIVLSQDSWFEAFEALFETLDLAAEEADFFFEGQRRGGCRGSDGGGGDSFGPPWSIGVCGGGVAFSHQCLFERKLERLEHDFGFTGFAAGKHVLQRHR